MRRTTRCFVTLIVVLFLLPVGQLRADPAQGFLMQGLLGLGAVPFGTLAGTQQQVAISAVPAVRLGGMLRPLAIAANLGFTSSGNLSPTFQNGTLLTLGPDVMPILWRGAGNNAHLYLLIGLNIGANIITVSTRTNGQITGGFSLGLGGSYFLHPNFGLGVEIGSRTQFISQDSALYGATMVYAGLTGSFVAGSR